MAEDLAARMDYISGRVVYDLNGTVRRLGLGRATVKRHVKVLRELGALVWLVHGSKRNLRMPGRRYTATGTVYGAAVPPVYDEAMGHRIEGSGYGARVCGVTEAGRERAVEEARHRHGVGSEGTVGNRSSQPGRAGGEPPSLGATGGVGTVEVSGGFNYTRTRVTKRSTSNRPHTGKPRSGTGPGRRSRRSTSGRSRGRTPAQVRGDIEIAEQVRRRVSWVRRETDLRRLAFVLRPLIDSESDVGGIAAALVAWSLTWTCGWAPQRPADYIAARLTATGLKQAPTAAAITRQQQLDAEHAAMRERAAADAAVCQAADAARPCADCGEPHAGGLCAVCDLARRLTFVVREAALVGIALRVDPRDPQAVQHTATACLHDTQAALDRRAEDCRAQGGDRLESALAVLDLAEDLRERRRAVLLRHLANGSEAEAAARRAYHHALNELRTASLCLHPTREQLEQARSAADQVRTRVAHRTLDAVLADLLPVAAPNLPNARGRGDAPETKPDRCTHENLTTPDGRCDRPAVRARQVCLRHYLAELTAASGSAV